MLSNISDKKLYHVTTPYCYGGFLFNLSLNVKVFELFRKKFKEYDEDDFIDIQWQALAAADETRLRKVEATRVNMETF